jgi:hypothetical protein
MSGTLQVGGVTLATHTESPSTLTLSQDIVTGTSSYGFAQLDLTSTEGTQGFFTWDTITGDPNITYTNDPADEYITLPYSGIYQIIFSGVGQSSAAERNFQIAIYTGAGSLLAMAKDQIDYLDSANSFGNSVVSYVSNFSANDTIKFYFKSDSGASVDLDESTHASIILLRRTA